MAVCLERFNLDSLASTIDPDIAAEAFKAIKEFMTELGYKVDAANNNGAAPSTIVIEFPVGKNPMKDLLEIMGLSGLVYRPSQSYTLRTYTHSKG